MNTITHEGARELIDRRLDGRLKANQQALLDDHLRSCETCRLYASEMDVIGTRLTQEFQARWDDHPGPSARLMEHVTSRAKRIPAANRLSSNVRFLSGAVALLLLALVVNFVVSKLQSTSASTNGTPTLSAPVNLTIDPQSCKPSTDVSAPNEIYGYDVVQNASLVEGDFTFDFWLYCDPSLNDNDQEHFSAVSGLGIYSLWRYNGPSVDGPVEYYYGFEENEVIGKSGSDGPLDQSSADSKFGINISEAVIRSYIQQGEPIQFHVTVNSSLGQNSAILSFHLEPTQSGLKVVDVQAHGPENFDGGLIAFAAEGVDGNSDIFAVRADGSGLSNLTNSPAQDSNPIWSRDGRHIAFESKGNGFSQIYMMDADGSSLIQLTNDNADHSMSLNLDGKSNPWSPDGKNLFFLQGPSGGDIWELYVMGVDGQNKTLLANGRFSLNSISWSPDGKHIAYVLNEASNPNEAFVTGIYIIDSNGSNSREIKNYIPQGQNLGAPYYWSADGPSIVFITSSEHAKQETIYEFNLDSDTVLEKNSLSGVVDWQNDVSLTWEKDFVWHRSNGSTNTLAWDDSSCLVDITRSSHDNFAIGAYCPDSHKFKLYVANTDGSVIKQLLDSSNIIGEIGELVWSQDDRYITFPIATDKKTSLYILNVEAALNNPSLEPEQIVIGSHDFLYDVPAWQPIVVEETGKKKSTPVPRAQNRLVAFTSSPEGNSDIFIMHSDGSGVENITDNLATDRNPVWSPDGQKIAFESDRDGRFDVYMMNVDGSDPTRLTTDPAFDALAPSYDSPWSPNGKQIIVQSNRSGKDALYVVPVEGNGEAIQISDTPGTIAWSPRGDQIAYSYVSEKSGLNNTGEHDAIRIVNLDGTNPRDIVQTGLIGDIHWSPDGTTIYYRNGAGLWVIERADAQDGKPETILSVEDAYFPGMAWFSPDSSIVYQSTDSQGQTSLYRWKEGASSLASELFKADPSDACEITPKEFYLTPGVVVSHDTNQAISYMNCESGQVVFILHDLTNNDSSILGRLLLVNPEIKVDWSQDDQVITIRVVQSDVSQSSGVQASLYVLYRNQLGQLPIVLTPVIEQTNGLTRTAIQPTP